MAPVANPLLLKKPDILYVDEDYSVKPPPYAKIELLMESLQKHGPLVAMGKMGPLAYREPSFKFGNKVDDQDVYAWKPNTAKENAPHRHVILLNANKVESKSYVYFTMAKDVTMNTQSLIRAYKPDKTDEKIYMMSYGNFLERSLVDLHPICPHAQWLMSVPVNAILDRGETEEKCKQVGQKIFDHYKTSTGKTEGGRAALIRICDAIPAITQDRIRKAHIARAWNGVGDKYWQWQS